jgi:rhodanese-related sulfurtransferase
MPKTIDQHLAEVRSRLARLDPRAAAAFVADGGLLIDIRPTEQRRGEGEIPGALIVERNVLEWRLDPASAHRLSELTGYGQPIVIICSEGYASSLAAGVLQELGLYRATDVDGGFRAWAAAGLPVRSAR